MFWHFYVSYAYVVYSYIMWHTHAVMFRLCASTLCSNTLGSACKSDFWKKGASGFHCVLLSLRSCFLIQFIKPFHITIQQGNENFTKGYKILSVSFFVRGAICIFFLYYKYHRHAGTDLKINWNRIKEVKFEFYESYVSRYCIHKRT